MDIVQYCKDHPKMCAIHLTLIITRYRLQNLRDKKKKEASKELNPFEKYKLMKGKHIHMNIPQGIPQITYEPGGFENGQGSGETLEFDRQMPEEPTFNTNIKTSTTGPMIWNIEKYQRN